MEKTPESEFSHLAEFEDGLLFGVWHRPVGGFVWADDLQIADGGGDPGPWLVAQGEDYERYPILREKTLLDEFKTLAKRLVAIGYDLDAKRRSQKHVLRFANRFGALGVNRTLESRSSPQDTVPGESISTWIAATSEVATYMQLLELVELRLSKRLTPFVEWRPRQNTVIIKIASTNGTPRPDLTEQIGVSEDQQYSWKGPLEPHAFSAVRVLAGPEHGPPGLFETFTQRDPIEPMRKFLQFRVNEALLGHVSRLLLDEPGGTAHIRYMPDRLIDVIYSQLQNRMAGSRAKETECENPYCPTKVFLRSRRDQRFCNKNCREQARYHRRKTQQSLDDDEQMPRTRKKVRRGK